MKNKILIFIFCIITFGLFAIPFTFAKSYRSSSLDLVNRVASTNGDGSAIFWVHADTTNIKGSGNNYYISLMVYDSNGNNISLHSLGLTFINGTEGNVSIVDEGSMHYACFPIVNSLSSSDVYFGIGSPTSYNALINNDYTFNFFIYRSTSTTSDYMYSNYFVPNNYYGLMSSYFGALSNLQVYLKLQGTTGMGTDISDRVLSYNSMRFSDDLISTISSNNDTNTYQYYIRVYFNQYIRNLVNFNLSYLEFSSMRMNNTNYSSYSSSRVALPILYNNIFMYNDNATLFNIDNLASSGYGDSFLEYIDFNIVNYSFKSSSYYNSNIGINGYISNTSITAMSLNNNEVYNTGYDNGYDIGYLNGKNDGFNEGVASNTTGFDNLFFAVGNVPMTILSGILNFEILGFNLLSFFMGIITLLLFVRIVRKFKE